MILGHVEGLPQVLEVQDGLVGRVEAPGARQLVRAPRDRRRRLLLGGVPVDPEHPRGAVEQRSGPESPVPRWSTKTMS
jgi:hypothetical protein